MQSDVKDAEALNLDPELLRQFRLIARTEGLSQNALQQHLMARFVNMWLCEQRHYQVFTDVTPCANPSRRGVSFCITARVTGLEGVEAALPLCFALPTPQETYEAWRIYPEHRAAPGFALFTVREENHKTFLFWQAECRVFDPEISSEPLFSCLKNNMKEIVEERIYSAIKMWARARRREMLL